MPYRHDIDGCLAGTIGEHGLAESELDATLAAAAPALDDLHRWHDDGSLPVLRLPARRDDLGELEAVAAGLRGRCDHVLVLGTGGSSLGGQTLYALVDRGFGPPAGTPHLVFLDNVDPDTFAALDAAVDWGRTGVIVISKSGTTAETLTQFLTLVPPLIAAGGEAALKERVVAITEPGPRALRQMAERWALPVLDHDPLVGGRFSVLSLVGLLPALVAGLDAAAVRAGAGEVLDATLHASDPCDSAPALGAAVSIGLARQRGAGTTVLLPYVDRLGFFGLWYRQLWAESLGKDGHGTTPVRAMGTVDQHSQLQLYLAGPRDKMFTVLMSAAAGTGDTVPPDLAGDPALGGKLDYLAGRTMGDLLDAEQRATADTLIRNQRPTRVMAVERVDEATLGALMMHFMLETIVAARILGVDAFDQPAVEEGKVLARQYLDEMAS